MPRNMEEYVHRVGRTGRAGYVTFIMKTRQCVVCPVHLGMVS